MTTEVGVGDAGIGQDRAAGSAPVIEVAGLGRTYRVRREQVQALRDVNFTIGTGEIVGLLGDNGAGKTTLTKILATLLLPTAGTALVFGHDVSRDVRDVRRSVGVVFGGERGLYAKLSGRDNLRFFAVLAGVGRRNLTARLDAALDHVGLTAAADRAVETYSKGMRQRLHIAIGMIGEPRLLLLDEPTVGLDPVEAQRLRDTVARLRENGVTILLTSHYLLDIERLADRVLILDGGTLAADLTVPEFAGLAGYTATVTIRGTGRAPDPEAVGSAGLEIAATGTDAGLWTLRLRVRDWGADSFGKLGDVLANTQVLDVDVAPLRLEDVYAQIAPALAARTRELPERSTE